MDVSMGSVSDLDSDYDMLDIDNELIDLEKEVELARQSIDASFEQPSGSSWLFTIDLGNDSDGDEPYDPGFESEDDFKDDIDDTDIEDTSTDAVIWV